MGVVVHVRLRIDAPSRDRRGANICKDKVRVFNARVGDNCDGAADCNVTKLNGDIPEAYLVREGARVHNHTRNAYRNPSTDKKQVTE